MDFLDKKEFHKLDFNGTKVNGRCCQVQERKVRAS